MAKSVGVDGVMRPRIFTCFFALLGVFLLQSVGANAVSASEIRHETIPSRYLSQDLSFLVYVPDGYDTSAQDYPVLYLLHGFGGNEQAWVQTGSIQAKADRLIASGTIPPALIVMPGCPRCWWVDGIREQAETAFWSELVPRVTSLFRTIDSREGRVIAGLSAGGYGAIHLALKYPERFAAAAAFSPAIYSETPPAASAARIYSPFMGADGKFNQAAWTENNYPRLIDKYFASGQRVPIYLVSGDHDKLGIAFETALFFKRIFDKQPDFVEMRVVDGGHSWAVWSAAVDEAMTYLFRFTSKPTQAIAARSTRNDVAQIAKPMAYPRH
jgi:enterochelin esterase-like enzyme